MKIPVKLKTLSDIQGTFTMNLICNNAETEVYKSDIQLKSGEEQGINPLIILQRDRIGKSTGICKIKALLGDKFILTDEFEISDKISVQVNSEKKEFYPGEDIIIEGNAVKENKENVEGYVEINIINEDLNENIQIVDTVTKGYFFVNFSFPKDAKAGEYLVNVKVYEKELSSGNNENQNGEITNQGSIDYGISILQVPTSLEIVFENSELSVNPDENFKVKAILHDQTGEKIDSKVVISVKDNEDKILKQEEISTDRFLEYFVEYNVPPKEWSIYAISNKIIGETNFKINEKEDIKAELINKTLIISNIGNIPYNKTLLIKIGNDTLSINITLDVDKTKKFSLSAPEGEYQVEILANGESKVLGMASLTGNVIAVKKSSRTLDIVSRPFVWFFMIGILGFVFFMVLKKGYKRSFIGYIHRKKKKRKNLNSNKVETINKKSPLNYKNIAELSLSLKGDKQDVSLICLKAKNITNISSKEQEVVRETLNKIIQKAEEQKGFVYESQDNLFFIFAPIITKTFKNEKYSFEIAQKIEEILRKHNRLFKQQIEYGISLNYGSIIAKKESSNVLKFMSLGTLIIKAKKIADIAIGKKEILLDEKIKDKLFSEIRAEKHNFNGVDLYTVKELKHSGEHSKFINDFVKRLEKD